jgi:uncharacterized protein YaiE (UPF0345 family)
MRLTRRTILILPAAGLVETGLSAQPASPPAPPVPSVPPVPPVPPAPGGRSGPTGLAAAFPSQDPSLAREMVGVSHGNVARVRELLQAHPALAKASWDWGYGDWETALGAASHIGNREIAGLLLAAGAGPTIFSAAMLGELEVVKAFVAASPGVQRTKGPHGISLLSHARAGGPGSAAVVAYLESLGDADPRYTNEPLAEADQKALTGQYAFGAGAAEVLTVAPGTRGGLTIKREGGAERNLFHLGSRVFHPPGAEAVRIRFEAGVARAASVTIEDGPLVVTAMRAG